MQFDELLPSTATRSRVSPGLKKAICVILVCVLTLNALFRFSYTPTTIGSWREAEAVAGYSSLLSHGCHRRPKSQESLEDAFLAVPSAESARNASHRFVLS